MRRYAFHNDGQLSLYRYCSSDLARHAFVTGGNQGGPNVFYHCTSTRDQEDIGPHMRWATGQLYDNVIGGQMRVWDRGYAGSGHGWSGNTIVFWNCESTYLTLGGAKTGFDIESPATGANYCIGCISDTDSYSDSSPWCCGANGIYQSLGERVTPDSLYEAQLADRTRPSPAPPSPFLSSDSVPLPSPSSCASDECSESCPFRCQVYNPASGTCSGAHSDLCPCPNRMPSWCVS